MNLDDKTNREGTEYIASNGIHMFRPKGEKYWMLNYGDIKDMRIDCWAGSEAILKAYEICGLSMQGD